MAALLDATVPPGTLRSSRLALAAQLTLSVLGWTYATDH
jgi:hypothetical protein